MAAWAADVSVALAAATRRTETPSVVTQCSRVNPLRSGSGRPSDGYLFRVVSTRLFGPVLDVDDSLQDTSVLVLTEQQEDAARGLVAAARRLSTVGVDGQLYNHEDLWNGLVDVTTANWISPVWRTSQGPALVRDCQGEVPEPMARTMTAFIVEELQRAGVQQAAVVSWPSHFDSGDEEYFPGEWASR